MSSSGDITAESVARRQTDIETAIRNVFSEIQLRTKAPNPDIRLARAEVYSILAVDIAELVSDFVVDRRILQRLRADDELFDALRTALDGKIGGCGPSATDIRSRMEKSVALKGKAVWTDLFVERYSPLNLPVLERLRINGQSVNVNDRLSTDHRSPLHYIRLRGVELKLFRDGVITFSVHTELVTQPGSGSGVTRNSSPSHVEETIQRLNGLSGAVSDNFRTVLDDLIRQEEVRRCISGEVNSRYADPAQKFELTDPDRIRPDELSRRASEHTVIFVENFYDGPTVDGLYAQEPSRNGHPEEALLPLQTVISSSSLAGILNAARWYEDYNSRYVGRLGSKEIGYKSNEIYLTDRKATVASTPGFWDERDPLSHYKNDIVLAVEYNVAVLAYLSSTLVYYQKHQDVRHLDAVPALDALKHAIDGRSILSLINESLDLSLLIDHGFTRELVRRLREEFDVEQTIGFIRQRVEDASTSVALRSSVLAAEQTSREGLDAALKGVKAAVENNELQKTIRRWARIAVAAAVLSSLASIGVSWWLSQRSSEVELPGLCVSSSQGASVPSDGVVYKVDKC